MLLPNRFTGKKTQTKSVTSSSPKHSNSNPIFLDFPVMFCIFLSSVRPLLILFVKENTSLDGAVDAALRTGMDRAGILCIGKSLHLLLMSTPIQMSCSSFTEALGFLLAAFYVFRIKYPESLTTVFGFLEYVAKVKSNETSITPIVKQFVAQIFPA